MTAKILLDTDIGSDLDDSVCLAYLLSQPGSVKIIAQNYLQAPAE